MSMGFLQLVAIIIALIIIGSALVRSTRQSPRSHLFPPDLVCPDHKCRHRNPPEANFCGKCGRRVIP
jgi:hypothetical protein